MGFKSRLYSSAAAPARARPRTEGSRFAKDMDTSVVRATGMFVLEIPDITANSCYIALFSAAETAAFRSFKDDCTIRIHEEHYRWERQ